MPHILGRESGLDDRMKVGEAEITLVTVENTYRSSIHVAKRCQQCGDLIEAGTVHSWVIIQYKREDEQKSASYPLFCDSRCMNDWVQSF